METICLEKGATGRRSWETIIRTRLPSSREKQVVGKFVARNSSWRGLYTRIFLGQSRQL